MNIGWTGLSAAFGGLFLCAVACYMQSLQNRIDRSNIYRWGVDSPQYHAEQGAYEPAKSILFYAGVLTFLLGTTLVLYHNYPLMRAVDHPQEQKPHKPALQLLREQER